MKKEFQLGDKLKDVVSGFVGIATSEIKCLNGCLRYTLDECEKKGQKNEFRTVEVDSQQLKRVGDGINKIKQDKTGGRARGCVIGTILK